MTKPDLPPDVVKKDLEYPKWESGDHLKNEDLKALGLGYESQWPGTFRFYKVKNLGWVLTTLHISNPSRRQKSRGVETSRSYGIGVSDSKVYTVGRGPHVEAEVEVYLSKANLERMKKYVELWKKGMADAGMIRDRISSRRAQGQINRAAGMSHWYW